MIKCILTLVLLAVTYGSELHRSQEFIYPKAITFGPLAPDYMYEAVTNAGKEYKNILRQYNLTIAQLKEKIQALNEKYNAQKEYKEEKELNKELNKKVAAILSNLSSIHKEYTNILEDLNQTLVERNEKLRKLRQKYPKEVDAIDIVRLMYHGTWSLPNLAEQLMLLRKRDDVSI